MSDWNKAIIEEFRANAGKVERFASRDLILLNTIGAKSGLLRVSPVLYLADRDRYAVIASNGGSPTHPDWYYNVVAHPVFEVEVGSEKFTVKGAVAEEPERTQLFNKMAAKHAFFAEYAENTERIIPVVILTRQA